MSPATRSRTKPWRWRSDIGLRRMLEEGRGRYRLSRAPTRGSAVVVGGREHHEHPAVIVVVGGEDVGHRPGRKVVLGVHLDRLVLDPNLPFQRGTDVVAAVV